VKTAPLVRREHDRGVTSSPRLTAQPQRAVGSAAGRVGAHLAAAAADAGTAGGAPLTIRGYVLRGRGPAGGAAADGPAGCSTCCGRCRAAQAVVARVRDTHGRAGWG